MNFEIVPIDSISPDPANVRAHPDRNLDDLKGSLRRFGQQKTISVDARGIILAGNGLYAAARALGWQSIAISRSGLEPVEATVYSILDNQSGLTSEWNRPVFDETVRALLSQGFDPGDLGFRDGELDELLGPDAESEPADDPGPEIDRADELRAKWGVEPGQLWRVGRHRLLCGDATSAEDVDRLMAGERADLCFTSPPYNLGNSVGRLRPGNRRGMTSAYLNDADEDPARWAALMDRSLRLAIGVASVQAVTVQLLAGNKRPLVAWLAKYADHLIDVLIWVKTNPPPVAADRVAMSGFEFIFVFAAEVAPSKVIPTASFGRGSFANVYASGVAAGDPDRISAAIFPEPFAAHHIGHLSRAGHVIYDPFVGSGTTIVACERLGRSCRAMDIEPAYVAATLERLAGMGLEPVRAETGAEGCG